VGIGADEAAAIDEDGWRAADFEKLSVFDIGVDGGSGFGTGHASLKGVGIQSGLAGIIEHFLVGVGGGNEVLVVVDGVVHLPEGFGVLHVGTTAGDGSGAGPGVEIVERKILEDELGLRVIRQDAAQGVMEVAANRALEVGVFDDGDGGVGIAEDG